jgi:hypothetical protein
MKHHVPVFLVIARKGQSPDPAPYRDCFVISRGAPRQGVVAMKQGFAAEYILEDHEHI